MKQEDQVESMCKSYVLLINKAQIDIDMGEQLKQI